MFCRTAFPRVCPRHAGEETKKCKTQSQHSSEGVITSFHYHHHSPKCYHCAPFLSWTFLGYCFFFKLSLPFLYITIPFFNPSVVYVNPVGGEVRLTRSALRVLCGTLI
ncbi:hypothetical protein BDV41DRAFT_547754 [Aspergillus transmontanensis]|uniref:Uncharacterized protein n=1 Tax=Aspergillus transmontanensis TaxID=1034304 RepID=A0A5N6VLQ8_9EURO|nr:hypothetical protein BDV41DRAFT_547754 [Aspergillus transmontanensis]